MSQTDESGRKSKSKKDISSKDLWHRRQSQIIQGIQIPEEERHKSSLFSEGMVVSLENTQLNPSLPMTEEKKVEEKVSIVSASGKTRKQKKKISYENKNTFIVEKSYASRNLFNIDYRKGLFFLKEEGNPDVLKNLGIPIPSNIDLTSSKENIQKEAREKLQELDKVFKISFNKSGGEKGEIDKQNSDLLVELNGNPFRISTTNVPVSVSARKRERKESALAGKPLQKETIIDLINDKEMRGLTPKWILRGLKKLSGLSKEDDIKNWLLKKGEVTLLTGKTVSLTNYERIKDSLKKRYGKDWNYIFADVIWDVIEKYELQVYLDYNDYVMKQLKKNGFYREKKDEEELEEEEVMEGRDVEGVGEEREEEKEEDGKKISSALPIPSIRFKTTHEGENLKGQWWTISLEDYIKKLIKKYDIKPSYIKEMAKKHNLAEDDIDLLKRMVNPLKEVVDLSNSYGMKIMHDSDSIGVFWSYWYYKLFENHLRDRITKEVSKNKFFEKDSFDTYNDIPKEFGDKKRWIREFTNDFLQKNMKFAFLSDKPIFKSFNEWRDVKIIGEKRYIDVVRGEMIKELFDWMMPNMFSQALSSVTDKLINDLHIEEPLKPIARDVLRSTYNEESGVWQFGKWEPWYFITIAGRVNTSVLGYVLRKQSEHIEVSIDSGSKESEGHKVTLLALSNNPKDITVEFVEHDQDEVIEEIKKRKKDANKPDSAPNTTDITNYCTRVYKLGEGAIHSALQKLLHMGLVSYIRTEGHYIPKEYRDILREKTVPPIFIDVDEKMEEDIKNGKEVPIEGIYPLKSPNEIEKMLVPGSVEAVVFNAILEMLRGKLWQRRVRVHVKDPETNTEDWSIIEIPVDMHLYIDQHKGSGEERELWKETIKTVDEQVLNEIMKNMKVELKSGDYGVEIGDIVKWMSNNGISSAGRRLKQIVGLITTDVKTPMLSMVGEDKVSLTGFGKFWAELIRRVNPVYLSPELTRKLQEDLIPETLMLLDLWDRIAKGEIESQPLTKKEKECIKKMKDLEIKDSAGFIAMAILQFLDSIKLDYDSLRNGIDNLLKSYEIGVYSPSIHITNYKLKKKMQDIEEILNTRGYVSFRDLTRKISTVSQKNEYKEAVEQIKQSMTMEKKPKEWDYSNEVLENVSKKLDKLIFLSDYTEIEGEPFETYKKRLNDILIQWNKWLGTCIERKKDDTIETLGLLQLEIEEKEKPRIIINKELMDQLLDPKKYGIKVLEPEKTLSISQVVESSVESLGRSKDTRGNTSLFPLRPVLKKVEGSTFEEKVKDYQDNIVANLQFMKKMHDIRDEHPEYEIDINNNILESKKMAKKDWNSLTKIITNESKIHHDIKIPELWTKIDFSVLLNGYLENQKLEGKKGEFLEKWIEKIENWR